MTLASRDISGLLRFFEVRNIICNPSLLKNDLIILQLQPSSQPFPKVLTSSSSSLSLDTDLAVIGFPEYFASPIDLPCGTSKYISFGTLVAETRHSCTALPGSSGSPIFSSDFTVVGLHNQGGVSKHNSCCRLDFGALTALTDSVCTRFDDGESDLAFPLNNVVKPEDLIQPIFVTQDCDQEISSIPPLQYVSLKSIYEKVCYYSSIGITQIFLLGVLETRGSHLLVTTCNVCHRTHR